MATSGMGGISFGGLASGLPSNIVDQLMQVEEQRLTGLQKKRTGYSKQKSAYSDLKTKLLALNTKAQALQEAATFRPHTASSSDENKVTATASSDARAGFHTVVTGGTLAAYDTWVATSSVTSSTDTLSGAENLTVNYNGVAHNIALSAGSTLSDIANTINTYTFDATDATKGVTASVLFDGTNYRLVLAAKESGTNSGAQRITVPQAAAGGWQFASGNAVNQNFANSITGTDAALTVDGIAVTSSSNTVSSVIPGVTLNLKEANSTVNITVSNDTDTLKETLNDFIDSYNTVIDFLNTEKNDRLSSDSAVRSIIGQLRGELNTQTHEVTGAYGVLSTFASVASLGFRTDQKTGKLSISSDDLDKAISQNFDAIGDVFTKKVSAADKTAFEAAGGKEGLAYRLEDLLSQMTTITGGVVTSKTNSIDSRIRLLDQTIDQENARLDKVRARLNLKFSNLEKLMSSLQSSGNALTSLSK
ncbi:MAG: flagellar filament capping protein FliD [Magnetococcales bacterium]|nr:flagellar filament capping protein FliD [Magnetococcales bacterium]